MAADNKWSSDLFEDALIVLKDLSLVQAFGKEMDGYWHLSLHPLIKDWFRLQMGTSTFQNNMLMAAMLLGSMMQSHWDWDKRLWQLPISDKQIILGHVIAQEENYEQHSFLQPAVTLNEHCLEDYASQQKVFADFLITVGFYDSAVKIYQRVLAIQEELFGLEHRHTLNSMEHLVFAYQLQGLFAEGKELISRVIETKKRVIGEEYPDTLSNMDGLALIYLKEGWFAVGFLLSSVASSHNMKN